MIHGLVELFGAAAWAVWAGCDYLTESGVLVLPRPHRADYTPGHFPDREPKMIRWTKLAPAAWLALITLMGSACPAGGQTGVPRMQALAEDEFRMEGTVRKAEVGMHCWRLEAKDGASYELRPEQVPAGLLTDGKAVTLVLKKRTDVMSTCMVGQIVDVVRVE